MPAATQWVCPGQSWKWLLPPPPRIKGMGGEESQLGEIVITRDRGRERGRVVQTVLMMGMRDTEIGQDIPTARVSKNL